MRRKLQSILQDAQELPREQLPAFFGDIAEILCTVMMRLNMPAPLQAQSDEREDAEKSACHSELTEDPLHPGASTGNGKVGSMPAPAPADSDERVKVEDTAPHSKGSKKRIGRDAATKKEETVIQKEYVSVREAEEITSRSAWTWRKDVRERKVASVKLGQQLLIPRSEIDRVMRENFRPARIEQQLG